MRTASVGREEGQAVEVGLKSGAARQDLPDVVPRPAPRVKARKLAPDRSESPTGHPQVAILELACGDLQPGRADVGFPARQQLEGARHPPSAVPLPGVDPDLLDARDLEIVDDDPPGSFRGLRWRGRRRKERWIDISRDARISREACRRRLFGSDPLAQPERELPGPKACRVKPAPDEIRERQAKRHTLERGLEFDVPVTASKGQRVERKATGKPGGRASIGDDELLRLFVDELPEERSAKEDIRRKNDEYREAEEPEQRPPGRPQSVLHGRTR